MSNIRLFNEDAMSVLSKIKDNSIDLVCIDPPYRTTSRGCSGTSGGMLKEDICKKGRVFKFNDIDIKEWLPELYRVLKPMGHCYIMTNNKNIYEYLDTIHTLDCNGGGFRFIKNLIWVKNNKIMGRAYMGQYEYIIMIRKGKFKQINNCGTSDILQVDNIKTKNKEGKVIHVTEKPVELIKVLVENSSNEGEIVLDCFMGIGSTGVACKELNRKFIGVEIDKEYFEVAKERLSVK